MIIAIDGPAASGKGTLARAVARHYGFAYLDTGALYRAVGVSVLQAGGDPANPADAAPAARRLDPGHLDDPALRTAEAGVAASQVAAIPEVRAAILDFQRSFAANPPGGAPGAVLDGRDIGTVVCPEAAVKLYVTANPQTRAHRRWLELYNSGSKTSEAQVLADVLDRDRRDSERPVSPLRQAADAHLLDTTNLSIEAAFDAAVAIIDKSTA